MSEMAGSAGLRQIVALMSPAMGETELKRVEDEQMVFHGRSCRFAYCAHNV